MRIHNMPAQNTDPFQNDERPPFLETDADPDPIRQFQAWFAHARQLPIKEPTAMTLATVTPGGRPSARVVLLKEASERGFTFFTNYQSRKGQELAENAFATLVFWWDIPHRQVRVEGTVQKVTAAESDDYFQTRPRGSQLSARASAQSEVVPDRRTLEGQIHAEIARFEGQGVSRPAHWGGYCVTPERIEFWQGRPDRLHDRLCYVREAEGWRIQRLAP